MLLASAAIVGFIIAEAFPLPLSVGFAGITQPAFVLMLFVLPLNAVLIVIAVCTIAGSCLRTRPRGFRRLAVWLNDCWYYVPPTLVIALAAPGPPAGRTGPSTSPR